MYDTYVTITGNVLHVPEWRRTASSNALLTTFKIASTSRRFHRESGTWVDGNSLRLRVTCWRALASNVASSVTRGDPLIVTGRLFTRDWTDEGGTRRTQYELEAVAIGHDLSRGRAVFERVRANTSTSAVEDAQARQRVNGELTEPVPDDEAPARFDDTPYEAIDREPVESPVTPPGGRDDPLATIRGAGRPVDPVGTTTGAGEVTDALAGDPPDDEGVLPVEAGVPA